jgi:large subunit ribosomal protein L25
MEEIKLAVQIREKTGTQENKRARRNNLIPAVVYGGQKNPTPVTVDRRSYEQIMRVHHGETVLFHLDVMQGDKKLRDYSVIIKEEQHDPVVDNVLHIDFYRISLTEKIEVKVSIETRGEPVGVKKEGGSLEHHLWELDVICLPINIPAHLTVDVTNLAIGDAIHVKDIALPAGVVTEHDPESIVVTVVPPMKEEPEKAEEAPTEPEVIKEKPKEEKEKKDAGAEKEQKKPEEAKKEGKKEEK